MHAEEAEMRIEMCNRIEAVQLPAYATEGSAGMDVQADIEEPVILQPGQRRLFPCGFKLAVPAGFEVQVRPRSGLALKHGLSVVNTPGTVDSDYRGEIGVILINHGDVHVVIDPGMRIAQIVLSPVTRAVLTPTLSLDATVRGEGGYGSTGVHTPNPVN